MLCVDNEAARAALTKGATENSLALFLFYGFWAVVAKSIIAF